MKRVLLVVLATCAACACPAKKPVTAESGSSAAGSGSAAPAAGGCEGVKAKVDGLYRALEPATADDNVAMVMQECAKAPDKVSACIAGVSTVKDLEATCMPQLSEEGSEADVLKQ